MTYSKEEYLHELFQELQKKQNYKDTFLKDIFTISKKVNTLSNQNSPRNFISLRVFEIIGLSYYSEDISKKNITEIANTILVNNIEEIYREEKGKLKRMLKTINQTKSNDIKSIQNILSAKIKKFDHSNSLNASDIILKMINEYNIKNSNININYDSRNNIDDDLISKQNLLRQELGNNASTKIFIETIPDEIYEELLAYFNEQDYLNKEKFKGNFTFSIIDQIIFSEIINQFSENKGKKLFYSKKNIQNIINNLISNYKNFDFKTIKNNIISNIITNFSNNKDLKKSENLKKYFEKWLKTKIEKIYDNFVFDIKIIIGYNSKDNFGPLSEQIPVLEDKIKKAEKLIMGNDGDLIYNYDNVFDGKNLLLLENIEEIKNDISIISPNQHHFENIIIKLINNFDNNINENDYNIFFVNLIKNGKQDILKILKYTNSVQTIKILNSFYLYLKENNLLEENKQLLEEIIDLIINTLANQNIGERVDNKGNEGKNGSRLNLVLFYLGYGFSNNGLIKIFSTKRINPNLENIIISKIKEKEKILNGYNLFLKNSLNHQQSTLKSSIKEELSINNANHSSNVLEYINIYNGIKKIIKQIKENIDDENIKELLIQYINERFDFNNIDSQTKIGKLPNLNIYINNNSKIISETNIIGQLFGVYIIDNFEYEPNIILKKEITKIMAILKRKKGTEISKKNVDGKKLLREKLIIGINESLKKIGDTKQKNKGQENKILKISKKSIDNFIKM